jgi:hypothetical protein
VPLEGHNLTKGVWILYLQEKHQERGQLPPTDPSLRHGGKKMWDSCPNLSGRTTTCLDATCFTKQ